MTTGAADLVEFVTVPLGTAVLAGALLPWLGLGKVGTEATSSSAGISGTNPGSVGGRTERSHPAGWIGAGLAIALLPTAFAAGDDSLLGPLVTIGVGATLGLGGAVLLRHPR